MIIELPTTSTGRIAPRRPPRLGFFHFSNNNLAIRKACAEDLGGYDVEMQTSEDVELCMRLAVQRRWVACREPGVIIRHKARRTLAALRRQIWGWGIRLGLAYRKSGERGFYAYRIDPRTQSIQHGIELPFVPGLTCIFLADFHLLHALLAGALALAVLGAWIAAGLCLLPAAVLVRRYLDPVRDRAHGPWHAAKLAAVHYLADCTFLLACFTGGLKAHMLLVSAPIFPPRGKAER